MRAGGLRKRANFEARNKGAAGPSGERLAAWATITGAGSVPCSLLPRKGAEIVEAGGIRTAQELVLTCRSNSVTRTITPDNRVTVDSVVFNIRAIVNPDQRNRALEMTLDQGAPE
jgi:head-tail adaptor